MSDVTRPTGGASAGRGQKAPDARGETALGTGPVRDEAPEVPPGARADHTAGTRAETTPGLHRGGTGNTATEQPADTRAATEADTPASGTHAGDDASGADADRGPGTHASSGISGTHAGNGVPGVRPQGGAHGTRLVPHEESDKLGMHLQHAVAGFVDEPRAAVEEADRVLEEIASRFTEAVTRRRRTLRMSWQSGDAGDGRPGGSADTEQLRLALRDYRELADRLLHL
ncbi:hypothetical protein GCM10010129_08700 [Streptomyces fumigatiscleroticus]|nr:hypothetical protein GCM10010129_08700 [Streptomyces fumigatiscleroticus]